MCGYTRQTFKTGGTHDVQNFPRECAICLCDLETSGLLTLSCEHTFHSNCLKDWFMHSNSCPLCRANACPPTELKVIKRSSFIVTLHVRDSAYGHIQCLEHKDTTMAIKGIIRAEGIAAISGLLLTEIPIQYLNMKDTLTSIRLDGIQWCMADSTPRIQSATLSCYLE